MASEQEMRKKIESTKNLAKITKSMKMVAASRMKVDEMKMQAARPFAGVVSKIFKPPADFVGEGKSAEEGPQKEMLTVISSDRGLCGGINSYISKATRSKIETIVHSGNDVRIAVIGEKGRSQISRTHGQHIDISIDEHTKQGLTYATCLSIADRIVSQDFDKMTVLHNSCVSMISYDQVAIEMDNMGAYSKAARTGEAAIEDMCPPHLEGYEFEPEDKAEALQNLFEFGVAGNLYAAIVDSNAAEQSARMQAMDNASKNANEMIDKFTLAYNRLRQAKITTELIEIISGAESLNSGED
jgi:F-type H+-transporting ATPase subunit gamma